MSWYNAGVVSGRPERNTAGYDSTCRRRTSSNRSATRLDRLVTRFFSRFPRVGRSRIALKDAREVNVV